MFFYNAVTGRAIKARTTGTGGYGRPVFAFTEFAWPTGRGAGFTLEVVRRCVILTLLP